MKPQHLLTIAFAAASLPGCAALFDAPPAKPGSTIPAAPQQAPAPRPVAAPAAAPMPQPPPQPVYQPVSAPYPVPATPVTVDHTPKLSAGPVHAAQPSMLRARPQASANVEAYIPAGATLTLRVQQTNSDGSWWFTEYEGKTGWVSERGLTP